MRQNFRNGLLSTVFVTSAMTMATLAASPAVAQVTTADIAGVVTDSGGAPISNAAVTVRNNQTGFTRSVLTNSTGGFAVRNLSISGLYDISISAADYQRKAVEGVALSLGDTTSLNFVLEAGDIMDEIIVVASRQVLADVAVGPAASFGLPILENAPAINRNIADVLRLDPRVYVDESRGSINSVQCVGQNSRFNAVNLDGVPKNDNFGLNANGYPTERQPFPFDALEQISVEIAPFDVGYGGFTACNINAVAKSGSNELHGGAFIDYTDDGLRGDKIKGRDIDWNDYDETRYGVHLGGPIIKDKLFFFAAYEKLEGANTYNTLNTVGTGNFQVSQAELDEIAAIAQNVSQYDVGGLPTSNDNKDEKVLVKLDWNINARHRASGTYTYNDGNNFVRSDSDSDELEFSKHLYERGAELNDVIGALYSDWTENFSTELRVGYQDLDNRQNPVGGTDFGEMQINTPRGVTVYLGADDSRQSNVLEYDMWYFSGRGEYHWNDHNFGFGAERKDLDVFNLFVQHTETEIRFNSIDAFRNGQASRVYYNNAPSQNPDDAAADWGYAINSVFAQDEWQVTDHLSIIAGLRYDWYDTNDEPTENPDFVADYGFTNAQTLDGEGLLQPRFAFTWDATNTVQITGGVGRYSGGNPNVWLSNTYSANNIDQVGTQLRNVDLFSLNYVLAEDGVPNGPGWAIPEDAANSVATGQGSNFEINYLDPDFKIPSEWKFALGGRWRPDFNTGEAIFGGEWLFQADVLYSEGDDTAIIQRGDLVQTGTQTIDGVTYPVYASPTMDSFVLTNSDKGNRSFVASLGASKKWDSGWGMTMGYAYSDAEDVQPMTSSVAFSNYNNRAFIDPQEDKRATSNYNIKHRFTASASYSKDFWKGYDTSFFTFFQHNTGRPYSLVYGNPNDFYNFTPYLEGGILLPGTKRNEFEGPSWTKVDFKITQQLPGLRKGDRTEVFMVVDNLTNLINDDWGVLEQPSFPRTLTVGQPLSTSTDASAYEIRFGARYDF